MRVRFALFAAVAMIALVASAGDDPPDDARGFAAKNVYDTHDLDAVNAFNGNLTILVPIGPEYRVGSQISYALRAAYNSHLWGYNQQIQGDQNYYEAYGIAPSNAGFGWSVSIATLGGDPYNADIHKIVFTTSDGGTHAFDISLPSPWYTNDGSGLRLTSTSTTWLIEGPSGVVYTFTRLLRPATPGPYTVSSVGPPYLTTIADRYGNAVTVEYKRTTAYPEVWVIKDGQRETTASFKAITALPGTTLETVVFKTGATTASTFTFSGSQVQLPLPIGDTSPGSQSGTFPAYLLSGIEQPPVHGIAATYAMTYDQSSRTSSGTITRLTLPTRGSIGWTFDRADIAASNGVTPRVNLDASPAIQRPLLVTTRTEYSAAGQALGTWTYHRVRGPLEFCPAICPAYFGNCGGQRQLTSWVTPPETSGDVSPSTTVSYFSTYDPLYDQCPAPGWRQNEYGTPLTHYATVASDKPGVTTPIGYLSNERRSGVNDAAVISSWNGQGSMSTAPSGSGILKRSQYVNFETMLRIGTSQPDPLGFDPAQLRDTTTIFDDDLGCGGVVCFSAVRQFAWDGVRHYRQSSTDGNFPGHNFRTTFVAFSPQTGSFWLPDVFTEDCKAENSQARTTAISGCGQLPGALSQRTNFDLAKGTISDQRTLLGGCCTLGAADLLTHLVRNPATGDVTSEQYFGGDNQALSTTDAFGAPSIPAYRIEHSYTYAGGSLVGIAAHYLDPASGTSVAKLSEDVLDPYTGLVSSRKDGSDLTTVLTYDARWRLETATPHGTNALEYSFEDATANSPATATEKHALSATNYASHVYTYDDFGRLVKDEARREDGSTTVVRTIYDIRGRTTAVSSRLPASASTPFPSTVYSSFDSFDRPGLITAADGSTLTIARTGARLATQTRQGIATPGGSASATTTEVRDRFGHLYKVTEPAGPTGAGGPTSGLGPDVTTTYGYDIADHLVSVSIGTLPQTRSFAYDKRGFMTSETHPELGAAGNDTTTFSGFDARGHANHRTTGSVLAGFDLKFTFDKAERLIQLDDNGSTSPRVLKVFSFGPMNAPDQTRLLSATRHNYLNGVGDVVVTEDYGYDAFTGRVRFRTTTVQRSGIPSPMQKFTQRFEYDATGNNTELWYPVPSGQPTPTITNTFSNGFLTKVHSASKTYGELTYNPNETLASVKHGTNGGADVLDIYATAPNGLPRPSAITFQGWQDCPAPTLTVAPNVCPNGSGYVASVAASGATTFAWTLSAGTITAGQNTPQITFTAPSNGPFTVSATVGGACSRTVSQNVNVATVPTAQVSGSTVIASGASASIRVDLTGTAPWSVTWSDGLVQSPFSSSPVFRSVSPSATTTYLLSSLTDSSSCPNGTSTGSAVVTVAPNAPSALTAVSLADTSTNPPGFRTVALSWSAVSGATSFEVERATSIHAAYALVASVSTTSYVDQSLSITSSPQTYIYRVWAKTGTTRSLTSSPYTFATVAAPLFTDEPVQANVTFIRGLHITELRRAIDEVRRAAELAPAWSSYSAPAGFISAGDMLGLRTALDAACVQIRGAACSYAGAAPVLNGPIQPTHIQSVRDAVK